jgi:hypothetical protein
MPVLERNCPCPCGKLRADGRHVKYKRCCMPHHSAPYVRGKPAAIQGPRGPVENAERNAFKAAYAEAAVAKCRAGAAG